MSGLQPHQALVKVGLLFCQCSVLTVIASFYKNSKHLLNGQTNLASDNFLPNQPYPATQPTIPLNQQLDQPNPHCQASIDNHDSGYLGMAVQLYVQAHLGHYHILIQKEYSQKLMTQLQSTPPFLPIYTCIIWTSKNL